MLNRRDEQTMMDLILKIAKNDERIRAVILNGSRTSPSATKDIFQDYDIVYVVNTAVATFVNDKQWIKQFGELLIMQTPDEMDGNWEKNKCAYGYLLQFKDWNRIDLTVLHVSKLASMHKDSQSIILLDKDHLIGELAPPSDKDYLPQPPTEKQFTDCCNEFLWVSTYVAKGIWRKELTYTKYMSEQIVKEELIKLLTWYAGIKSNFEKTIGKCGKHLEKNIEPEIWNQFVKTYTDAGYTHMWNGLFMMCEVFNSIALKISSHYKYPYNEQEYKDVVAYLKSVKDSMRKRSK